MKQRRLFITILIALLAVLLAGCAEKPAEKSFDSFESLDQARIGVMTGSTGEQLAMEHFPDADIKSFDDTMDAVTALLAGQVDAILTGYPTAFNVTRSNPDLLILPEAVAYEDTCVAMRQGEPELLADVNAVIAGLQSSGELDEIIARWYRTDFTPYEELHYDLPAEGIPLRIGVNATREPTSFLDAAGNFTGLDAEIAYNIAIALGRPVEILDMNFSALIPALQAGKIDLIVTGMSATDERRLSVDFSEPYFANRQVLTVRKPAVGSGLNMVDLADLADKRIGVYSGTVFDKFVQENYPDAQIFRYNAIPDMIVALQTDKIDAAFFDLFSARLMMNNNPDLGILSDEVLDLPLGIGFSRQNPDLRQRFNTFLTEAVADGTMNELEERWFNNNPEEAVMPEFDFSEFTEEVMLGVAVGDLPYIGYVDGRYVGHDVELISRFAEKEEIKLEIITMEFSALISALAAGKVDMIADGIAITEERSQQVDFSDSYTSLRTAVVALKTNLAAYSGAVEPEPDQPNPFSFTSLADSFYRNLIFENRYMLIIDGLQRTVVISVLSCFFGTILGSLICFMRMSKNSLLSLAARSYISVLRGIPALVLLMLIFYVIFASVNIQPVLVAVIAFGMNFAAYVSEMFRTSILSIDKGQWEAGIASGFSKFQTFLHIILPQAVNRVLPVYKGEFISMVKMTSVVGYIAVQDLTKAGDIIRSRTFDAFFPLILVALLYLLISSLLGLGLDYLSYKTDARAQRGKVRARQVKPAAETGKGMAS